MLSRMSRLSLLSLVFALACSAPSTGEPAARTGGGEAMAAEASGAAPEDDGVSAYFPESPLSEGVDQALTVLALVADDATDDDARALAAAMSAALEAGCAVSRSTPGLEIEDELLERYAERAGALASALGVEVVIPADLATTVDADPALVAAALVDVTVRRALPILLRAEGSPVATELEALASFAGPPIDESRAVVALRLLSRHAVTSGEPPHELDEEAGGSRALWHAAIAVALATFAQTEGAPDRTPRTPAGRCGLARWLTHESAMYVWMSVNDTAESLDAEATGRAEPMDEGDENERSEDPTDRYVSPLDSIPDGDIAQMLESYATALQLADAASEAALAAPPNEIESAVASMVTAARPFADTGWEADLADALDFALVRAHTSATLCTD